MILNKDKNIEFPKRKPTRLKGYDYSLPGAYFITICTHNKEKLLSQITVGQGLAPAENKLSVYGRIAKEQIDLLETHYSGIKIDKYVIMPNHIHIIISNYEMTAGASPCPTISDVVCLFKSVTTRMCKKAGLQNPHLFQSSFHDHIIRGEKDYQKIWEYIDTNVIKWKNDCFYNN
ncbi:MAG: transposase [Clostridia bacterium]|nr:transposase [Clostridia bacterium]